jgi:hypothetical protein
MERPHTAGAPTKLTPKLHKAMVRAVRGGMPVPRAAELVGLKPATVKAWLRRGDEAEESDATATATDALCIAFARDIHKALAYDEQQRIKRIREAGQGGKVVATKTVTRNGTEVVTEKRLSVPDWRADAWHLSRTRPKEWGQRADLYIKLDIQRLVAKYAEQYDMDADMILREAESLVRLLPMELDDDARLDEAI